MSASVNFQQDGAAVAREAHNFEVAGSIPAPAPISPGLGFGEVEAGQQEGGVVAALLTAGIPSDRGCKLAGRLAALRRDASPANALTIRALTQPMLRRSISTP